MWQRHETKKARVEAVKALLASNDKAVIRGLLRLYERQTAAEQCSEQTTEANGVGFSAFDAEYLTWAAKSVLQTGRWGPGLIVRLRPRLMKYSRQLAEIAEAYEAKQCLPTMLAPETVQ